MTGLRFHERMRGWISFDARDYNRAALAGRRAGGRCSMAVTADIGDLDRFLCRPGSSAQLSGRVSCPQLGGELSSEDGTFRLLAEAPDAEHRRVVYRLFLRDGEDRPLTLSGFKLVERGTVAHPWLAGSVWIDTTRLLVRILAGHVPEQAEREDDAATVATGVLRISSLGFAREVLTMRGRGDRRWRAPARYDRGFLRQLRTIYGGAARPGQFAFPAPVITARPEGFRDVPGRPDLRRRVVRFDAGDGCEINLHHLRLADARGDGGRPRRGPVLLIGGLAMRAEAFYTAPQHETLADRLLHEGFDVWVENWRTSIDLPAGSYTLDHAAVHDHPAAIAQIQEATGAERLDAVAHCMGSASLTMSVLAGQAKPLRTVVSSAVSYHIDLAALSRSRLRWQLPVAKHVAPGTDPQWVARAPSLGAAGLARMTRAMRAYRDPLVDATAYIYSGEVQGLWRQANVDGETLVWLAREFGYAPFSFFEQMRASADAGHLVPATRRPELANLEGKLPPDGTSFVFLAGAENQFFLPDGQKRTHDAFNANRDHVRPWKPLAGFSHLDVLIGKRAAARVFPGIVDALKTGAHV
jgi:hypothetical protein